MIIIILATSKPIIKSMEETKTIDLEMLWSHKPALIEPLYFHEKNLSVFKIHFFGLTLISRTNSERLWDKRHSICVCVYVCACVCVCVSVWELVCVCVCAFLIEIEIVEGLLLLSCDMMLWRGPTKICVAFFFLLQWFSGKTKTALNKCHDCGSCFKTFLTLYFVKEMF